MHTCPSSASSWPRIHIKDHHRLLVCFRCIGTGAFSDSSRKFSPVLLLLREVEVRTTNFGVKEEGVVVVVSEVSVSSMHQRQQTHIGVPSACWSRLYESKEIGVRVRWGLTRSAKPCIQIVNDAMTLLMTFRISGIVNTVTKNNQKSAFFC